MRFPSGGVLCAAWHYAGDGAAFGGAAGRPCVVMAHGFGATRDCGIEPFAEAFAAAGLDVLLFDHRHLGASEGEPRQLVSVARQHEDWAAATAFARSLDRVDPDRIVLWGTSYAGGHVLHHAARDARVAAVVAQTPHVDGLAGLGRALRRDGAGSARGLVLALRDAARGARGAEPLRLPITGAPGDLAVLTSPDAERFTAVAGPTWRNEVCARSILEIGGYRPGRRVGEIRCPILFVLGDRDELTPPDAAQRVAFGAPGRAEVRRYPMDHTGIYESPMRERAIADQLFFLRRHLGAHEPHAPAARAPLSR